jgi:Domain of unknown function (DUF4136)
MRRLLPFAAVTVSALGLTACATMTVSSHAERGLDFAQYRTYHWGPADALPTGDPRLDRNPFFQDHVQGAVEKHLAAKGLERSTSGTADLLMHYHASINQRIDVNRIDREYGYCYDQNCQVRVIDYEAGTLVLDLVDTRTNRLIWRGWAQNSVEGLLGDQDRMARNIDEAVRRMLRKLPRGL